MTSNGKPAVNPRVAAEAPAVQAAFLVMLILVLWIVYRPGLTGPFVFDDYHNIGGNPYLAIDEISLRNLIGVIFSRAEGMSNRPLAMLSFAFNYYFSGQALDVFHFKLTNLAIHAANIVLVYVLLRSLLVEKLNGKAHPEGSRVSRRAVIVAALAAALWGLHPLQLTSVLYVVQRMSSLSTFFVLAGLLLFFIGRRRFAKKPMPGAVLMCGGLAGGVTLGFLCKENAILLPGFAILIELVVFERASLTPARKRQLAFLYAGILGAPALFVAAFLIADPSFILGSYINRDFTLTERLMTEARALFFYASLIFLPILSRFGLFHDDFQLSTGLLDPLTTLTALAAWVLILVALIPGLRRRKMWAFGISWFLVGHSLESTIIGLELIHEHRNYLPSVGLIAAAAYYFCVLAKKVRMDQKLVGLVALSTLLVLSFVTHSRASVWSTRLSMFQYEAQHHPNSSRALSEYANILAEGGADIRVTYKIYRDAARVDQAAVTPLIIMQKMIQVLMVVTSESNPPVSTGDSDPSPAIDWTADLVIEPNRLLQSDKAVSREITRRLKTVKPTAETLSFLQRTQGCALSGQKECLRILDRIIDWHQIVIRRMPHAGRFRAAAELSLARIFAFEGHMDRALDLADRAIASSNGHLIYRVEKAILLAKLGRTEEAEAIVTEIEKDRKISRGRARDIAIVREVIRQTEAAGAPVQ